MPKIDQICDTCNATIQGQFDPTTGTRTLEIIAGDRHVSDTCFVRDEIRFLGDGRLIFDPGSDPTGGQQRQEFFVICRKLVVTGGRAPGGFDPCGPDDPGHMYTQNNAIIWNDRLHSADSGADPSPQQAATGTSHDRNVWSDQGQGNNGANGGNGENGINGTNGSSGRNAPPFTLLALEVEIGFNDHLTIDFDGQNGGAGGRGQDGGDGGNGMGGRDGDSDTSWPGVGCDRQPGHGGDGGNGGDGGTGGNGGAGGAAGGITIVSLKDNITGMGPFVGGRIHYVNDGGDGGEGGRGGFGGRGGRGGHAGRKTQECDAASDGDIGYDGLPDPGVGPGSTDNMGGGGAHGSGAGLVFEELTEDTCADLIPLPIKVDVALDPAVYCRGYDTAGTGEGTIVGEYLTQVDSVEVSGLVNVTAVIQPSSDDNNLDLRFNIAADSGLGPGDLILQRDLGADETLTNAIEVRRFEVLSLTPNSGERGNLVNVQINGTCFDPAAAIQQVSVSGAGVTVSNVVVVDSETVTCGIDIAQIAPLGLRDVTVRTGPNQHTLTSGFSII